MTGARKPAGEKELVCLANIARHEPRRSAACAPGTRCSLSLQTEAHPAALIGVGREHRSRGGVGGQRGAGLLGAEGGLDKGEERGRVAGVAEATQGLDLADRRGEGDGGAGDHGEVGAPGLEPVEDVRRHEHSRAALLALLRRRRQNGGGAQWAGGEAASGVWCGGKR